MNMPGDDKAKTTAVETHKTDSEPSPNVLHGQAQGQRGSRAQSSAIACSQLEAAGYVWDVRKRSPNTTPASTVLNSPDLNPDSLQFGGLRQPSLHAHNYAAEQRSLGGGLDNPQSQYASQHNKIRVGHSPGCQFEQRDMLPQGLSSPGSPTAVGQQGVEGSYYLSSSGSGGIVVFDDIVAGSGHWSNADPDDVLKVTKLIGQLPITQYEGSPRRFGKYSTKAAHVAVAAASAAAAILPKRPPGFPQRVSPVAGQQQQHTEKRTTVANDLIDLVEVELPMSATNVADPNLKTVVKSNTFDYLYEFSETRKVLEEFFKAHPDDEVDKRFQDFTGSGDDMDNNDARHVEDKQLEQAYIGQRLARLCKDESYTTAPKQQKHPEQCMLREHNNIELYVDSNSPSSADLADTELEANLRRHSRNFTLSPETTDYDSNCGDLDSLSNDINCATDYAKLYTSMPILEDGLSSGHASDTDNNVLMNTSTAANEEQNSVAVAEIAAVQQAENSLVKTCVGEALESCLMSPTIECKRSLELPKTSQSHTSLAQHEGEEMAQLSDDGGDELKVAQSPSPTPTPPATTTLSYKNTAPETTEIQEAMKDIRTALQRAKTQPEKLKICDEVLPPGPDSPVWVPRKQVATVTAMAHPAAECVSQVIAMKQWPLALLGDEEEADTDLETDRLLGQQRIDEHQQDMFDETSWSKVSRIGAIVSINNEQAIMTGVELTADADVARYANSKNNNINNNCNNAGGGDGNGCGGSNNNNNVRSNGTNNPPVYSTATLRQGVGTSLTPAMSPDICQIAANADAAKSDNAKSPTGSTKSESNKQTKSSSNKEGNSRRLRLNREVLIEGVLFRANYLGSTQLVCEGQPTKSTRMMQAEEAVSRIKAPEGESQPSTAVDLFISTEKIMVLNTDLKEIMMDHSLRTISYIADIGELVVLMARRHQKPANNCGDVPVSVSLPSPNTDSDVLLVERGEENGIGDGGGSSKQNRTPKMVCHVFESSEAQFIAQSIGQAFQVAYMEFLKANGVDNEHLSREMDYQEVLNCQEIFGDELEIFAKKERQKEVVVPKAKGEILGVVIVESGWGSMLPTVVIANLMSGGAAARCGQLNIGDQLIAINGLSLVGLPLSTCQTYIRNAKNQTAVKFTVVPCPPVVEVKILRPKALFQLGFSVQNGVICSLLRGGIAERGGVRVGHRIIEINNQSVVAVPHDTIVKLLSSSVGEILMKTMPTSMFRLLTGQETPIYI